MNHRVTAWWCNTLDQSWADTTHVHFRKQSCTKTAHLTNTCLKSVTAKISCCLCCCCICDAWISNFRSSWCVCQWHSWNSWHCWGKFIVWWIIRWWICFRADDSWFHLLAKASASLAVALHDFHDTSGKVHALIRFMHLRQQAFVQWLCFASLTASRQHCFSLKNNNYLSEQVCKLVLAKSSMTSFFTTLGGATCETQHSNRKNLQTLTLLH